MDVIGAGDVCNPAVDIHQFKGIIAHQLQRRMGVEAIIAVDDLNNGIRHGARNGGIECR